MAKSKFTIEEINPDEKGAKYVLEMDGIKNIGNRYAFSEEELTELWLTITRALACIFHTRPKTLCYFQKARFT